MFNSLFRMFFSKKCTNISKYNQINQQFLHRQIHLNICFCFISITITTTVIITSSIFPLSPSLGIIVSSICLLSARQKPFSIPSMMELFFAMSYQQNLCHIYLALSSYVYYTLSSNQPTFCTIVALPSFVAPCLPLFLLLYYFYDTFSC